MNLLRLLFEMGVRSSIYRFQAGVRQGGVLSPVFFRNFRK